MDFGILIAVATVLNVIAYLPQIIKILRTKHAEDLSMLEWCIWSTTSVLEIAYYISVCDIWLLIEETACMACNITIFVLTIKYKERKTATNYSNYDIAGGDKMTPVKKNIDEAEYNAKVESIRDSFKSHKLEEAVNQTQRVQQTDKGSGS